jgi:hypothetical protein
MTFESDKSKRTASWVPWSEPGFAGEGHEHFRVAFLEDSLDHDTRYRTAETD